MLTAPPRSVVHTFPMCVGLVVQFYCKPGGGGKYCLTRCTAWAQEEAKLKLPPRLAAACPLQQGRPSQGRGRLPSPRGSPRGLQIAARELPLEQTPEAELPFQIIPLSFGLVLLEGKSMEHGGRAVCECMDGLGLRAHNELTSRLLITMSCTE